MLSKYKSKMIAYITELNSINYEQFTNSELVLVFIYADWCEVCKIVSPIVDEISTQLKVGKVNIEVFTPNVQFRDVPTFVFYKDGEVLERLTGFEDKEKLVEFFNLFING